MNEVVEDEKDENVEDGENPDVHNQSGPGCLTSTATHASVSHEPKM